MRVLNRHSAAFLFAMSTLGGLATWTMAGDLPSNASSAVTKPRHTSEPALIPDSDGPGYAIVSHCSTANSNKKASRPTPTNSERLKVIPPDVSRPSVRLVGHITPLQAAKATGSVPVPVWSKPVPVRRSIVRVQ